MELDNLACDYLALIANPDLKIRPIRHALLPPAASAVYTIPSSSSAPSPPSLASVQSSRGSSSSAGITVLPSVATTRPLPPGFSFRMQVTRADVNRDVSSVATHVLGSIMKGKKATVLPPETVWRVEVDCKGVTDAATTKFTRENPKWTEIFSRCA